MSTNGIRATGIVRRIDELGRVVLPRELRTMLGIEDGTPLEILTTALEGGQAVVLRKQTPARPRIVCLCGSTRFMAAFRRANYEETLAGRIVLTLGHDSESDDDLFAHLPVAERAAIKARLDELHLRKIDLADEVLILNVGGYIGQSTGNELRYAREMGKAVRFLEPEAAPDA